MQDRTIAVCPVSEESLTDTERFISRLSSLRLASGMSARELSRELGKGENYICRIEKGISVPTMSSFFAICRYFDISPKEFFSRDKDQSEGLDALQELLRGLTEPQLEWVSWLIHSMEE